MSVIWIEWMMMRAVKRAWIPLKKMESPTVESPTRHFAEGFADRMPHSQAGPPQKGRSDVSHLN